MDIKQFRYASDNFGYLVFHKGHGIAIDGGAVDPIIAFGRENGISIDFVTNTHTHADHTIGTKALLNRSDAEFIDCRHLKEGGVIPLGDDIIKVEKTPGHTMDSVVFAAGGFLVTGDTVFNGTVGNCFTGRLDLFFDSIQKILAFAPETKIFAGHDYLDFAMAVAKKLEPGNTDIDKYLHKCNPDPLFSTIADELCVNPYLRYNSPGIIEMMQGKGLPTQTEYERWESIMSLE